jgi:hypothetical protein
MATHEVTVAKGAAPSTSRVAAWFAGTLIITVVELQRTAEANLRMVHLEILKMAIDDPDLAVVWPPFETNPSVGLNRQYLYANIIYQFHWASLRVSGYSDEQVLESLRYLFRSPIMRGYWRAAALARTSLEQGSPEETFARRVDELCRDYEAVANATRGNWAFEAAAPDAVPLVNGARTKDEAA